MPPHRARTLLLLSSLVLIGLGLRVLGLGLQPLWWDEGYSLYFATETPATLVRLTALDIHPPLYYLLLQGWLATVGIGALAARWFSVLVGVATLPVMWWVARGLAGRRVAWLATLLLTLSPFHIYYSQEVRMYALLPLFALLAVGLWQRRKWGALGVVVVAGLLTHYYFALLLAALALLILWKVRTNHVNLRGPLRSLAIAVIGYSPWLIYAGLELVRYVGGKLEVEADAPLSPLQFLPRHLVAFSVGHLSSGWGFLAWGALAFVVLALLGIVSNRVGASRSHLTSQRVLATLLLVPLIATFLIGLGAPFVDPRIERQLLFVLPFFLILVAQGIEFLRQRWAWASIPATILLITLDLASLGQFYTLPRYPNEDYRPILARVGAEQGPGDGWLAIYPWQLGYLRAYLPHMHPTPIIADLAWVDDTTAMQTAVAQLLQTHPRLWFPAYQVRGRLFEEELTQTLNATGVQAWNEWDGNTRLFLFGSAPPVPTLLSVGTFQDAGELRAALAGAQASSGTGILPIFLEADAVPDGLRVSLQLIGRGSVWGEWDGAVTEGVVRAGLPILHGTPPGDYTVQLSLYREANSQPLDRFDNGQRTTPEATLGTVTVTRPPAPQPPAALQQAATLTTNTSLGDTVQFIGATLPERDWLQGEQVPLTLFWQPLAAPGSDLNVFVQAMDTQGLVRAARDLPPVNGTFPTSQWQAGDLVRDPHLLDLPADMPPGDYRLVVGLYDPATGARLTAANGQDALEIGHLHIQERDRLFEEPAIGTPLNIPFGTRARLARTHTPPGLQADTALDITLVWQATETGGSPLRAFAQLYRGDNQVAVSDHPADPPATAWRAGEWIVDPHQLTLPPDLPPGDYRLIVGLYDANTGARLPTPDGNWATIATWTISAP